MGSMGKIVTGLSDSFYSGKRVLVTGDTGFKGSWLTIWLLSLNADIYGYALPPKQPCENFIKTNLEKRYNHTNGDIRDKRHLAEYLNSVKPEIIFHLAAQPLVIEAYKDPVTTFETNIMGTVNLLEAIRKVPSVKAVVIITTDKVYKNNNVSSGYIETDELGGDEAYSASKACSEMVVNSYAQSYFKEDSVNIATARAGNVIGGGDWAENRIVPDIFRFIEMGKDIIIRNPAYIRPWQFVLEPLLGYLMLGEKLYQGTEEFQGAWNFGPDVTNQCTVLELTEKFIKKIGKGNIIVENQFASFSEAKILRLDNSKAKEQLGWYPLLNINETIDYTIEGYAQETTEKDLFQYRVDQINKYMHAVSLLDIHG